jgi:hypothetical protein
MATLTNSDFTEIKKIAKRPQFWPTFKAWGLDRATWENTFQAMEDYFVNAFTTRPAGSWKAALEVEGGAMTNGQAKAIADVWGIWRINHQ